MDNEADAAVAPRLRALWQALAGPATGTARIGHSAIKASLVDSTRALAGSRSSRMRFPSVRIEMACYPGTAWRDPTAGRSAA